MSEVSKLYETELLHTKHSGAGPRTVIKNLMVFKKSIKQIVHITGDVHYMALVTGKTTVLTIHDIGSAINGSFLKRFYIKLFWFWLPALFVKRITVISNFTKRELVKIIPFARHKIRIVSNPVDDSYVPNYYTFNDKCPTILCVGTKSNKNLERVFESVKDINCQLHIIGNLSDLQIKQLEDYNINYSNSYSLTQEEIMRAYQNCDILCFPSTYEGFGMPIIEAQAIGRPVITSKIGAMLEIAQNSACLVNPCDSNSIKEGIERVISDSQYRKTLIEKGFENIKRFQLDMVVKQYINIYKELGL